MESIYKYASRPMQIECVVRVDDDDEETLNAMDAKPPEYDYLKFLTGPHGGFYGLASAWNECAKAASGDYLLIFNDDSTFRQHGWDDFLWDKDPKEIWLAGFMDSLSQGQRPDIEAWVAFPAISRAFYEAIGHLTEHCLMDNWLYAIYTQPKIGPVYRTKGVYINHDRPQDIMRTMDVRWRAEEDAIAIREGKSKHWKALVERDRRLLKEAISHGPTKEEAHEAEDGNHS